MKIRKLAILLLCISFFLGAYLRLYNTNWDENFHLHPDERAIILSVVNLKFPSSIDEFFSTESTWNPHFFAYGSLPFYILRSVGDIFSFVDPLYGYYDKIHIIGRYISALSDIGTIIVIYLIGKRLHNTITGSIAAFFYSISVLPIQLSHFYAVDTLLTFFIMLTLYRLVKFTKNPSLFYAILLGMSFGFALATKISASILLLPILASFLLFYFLRKWHTKKLTHYSLYFFTIFVIAITTLFICSPYIFLDFTSFWIQTLQQSNMTRDAFTFPYTLQYVGKTPYIYEIKNIFFWGMGPLLAFVSLIGTLYYSFSGTKKLLQKNEIRPILLIIFFWIYFLIVGKFAIGFMRYMLPIYPLLCLFAAYTIITITNIFSSYLKKTFLFTSLLIVCFILLLIWPLSFMHIYIKQHTRITATNWIHAHIPKGATIATEHWDDQLPIYDAQKYINTSLALYGTDSPQKWEIIYEQLNTSDYIVIASNRLYTPLQKLTNCEELPPGHCYKKTAKYYQNLFSGELGYKKVAEFSSSPTIPFSNILINDQSADESFTVYDHPKIMIFKK